GVSILEREGGRERFRWRAAAGRWSEYRGEVMPRDGPSGVVIDRNTALLLTRPERCFDYAAHLQMPIEEALLIPFHAGDEPVGTIWIIAHDDTRRFDAEDRRLMESLGRFASHVFHLMNEERLARDLVSARQLQEVSTQLLGQDAVEALYER